MTGGTPTCGGESRTESRPESLTESRRRAVEKAVEEGMLNRESRVLKPALGADEEGAGRRCQDGCSTMLVSFSQTRQGCPRERSDWSSRESLERGGRKPAKRTGPNSPPRRDW